MTLEDVKHKALKGKVPFGFRREVKRKLPRLPLRKIRIGKTKQF